MIVWNTVIRRVFFFPKLKWTVGVVVFSGPDLVEKLFLRLKVRLWDLPLFRRSALKFFILRLDTYLDFCFALQLLFTLNLLLRQFLLEQRKKSWWSSCLSLWSYKISLCFCCFLLLLFLVSLWLPSIPECCYSCCDKVLLFRHGVALFSHRRRSLLVLNLNVFHPSQRLFIHFASPCI